jgi:hypothetical protein
MKESSKITMKMLKFFLCLKIVKRLRKKEKLDIPYKEEDKNEFKQIQYTNINIEYKSY